MAKKLASDNESQPKSVHFDNESQLVPKSLHFNSSMFITLLFFSGKFRIKSVHLHDNLCLQSLWFRRHHLGARRHASTRVSTITHKKKRHLSIRKRNRKTRYKYKQCNKPVPMSWARWIYLQKLYNWLRQFRLNINHHLLFLSQTKFYFEEYISVQCFYIINKKL